MYKSLNTHIAPNWSSNFLQMGACPWLNLHETALAANVGPNPGRLIPCGATGVVGHKNNSSSCGGLIDKLVFSITVPYAEH